MKAISRIRGTAIPFGANNVDTDIIINARHLKTLTRTGLGPSAFAVLREKRDNLFDRPEYRDAPILVAGENFGCGSSREHAVWALIDRGIEAVIARSFADIFSTNAYKNGLLLVALGEEELRRLLEQPLGDVEIDLASQTVKTADHSFRFEIDPFRKHCLVNGLDEIALTLQMEADIAGYEHRLSQSRPWVEAAGR